MAVVATCCVALLVLTTVIHYEVLRAMTVALPMISVRARAKLIVVIVGAFFTHTVEIMLYALAIYLLAHYAHLGALDDTTRFSLSVSFYFSAETYTSLGYGDLVPGGGLRLLAGGEALNGLLLIGWSASYTYIAMERFWTKDHKRNASSATQSGNAVTDGDAAARSDLPMRPTAPSPAANHPDGTLPRRARGR
jgi:Ion channel